MAEATWDAIIIGAGAAGVAAAIDAAQGGLRPLVLEAFPEYGGAARTGGGGCCVPGTPLQRELGLEDTPDLALKDWLAWGGESADGAWAEKYLRSGLQDLYLWAESLGVIWDRILPQEGNSVPRWHHPVGGGAGLMKALYARAGTLPVTWRFSAPATRLLIEAGRVQGVEATVSGEKEIFFADKVLVSTGGFNNNLDMVMSLVPDPGPGSRILAGGARQALGTGHRLLEEAGAHFTNLERIWMYPFGTPDHLDPEGRRGLVVRGVLNEVWVNAQGQRFHNERKRGGWSGTRAVMAQTPKTCWAVFDRSDAQRLTLADPYYRTDDQPNRERIETFLRTSPFVHAADSFEALAEKVGLPPDAFAEAMAEANRFAAAGERSDPFGRNWEGDRQIQDPPFYALQFFPLARKNFGGVKTDLFCRVERPDGTLIGGLYAAGEVSGMAGGHINGQAGLEGTMIGPSLFSGRVAGRAMAAG